MSFVARDPAIRFDRKRPFDPDHVTVLMAVKNGAGFIDAQLNSIASQTHRNWSLIVSDDGSDDDTMERVGAFATRNPNHRVTRLRGPGQGSALNFLSLLRAAGHTPWAAFSDQDDVWRPDRLARGLSRLKAASGPALYGGRTVVTDAKLSPLGLSPSFGRPPAFANALVQNIAGGNTMLLNRAALDLLQPASRPVRELVAHDWWAYQLVTSVGGQMIWDPEPTVFYRQHGGNQIGANDGWRASYSRAQSLMSGQFSKACQSQFEALSSQRYKMTDDARKRLDAIGDLCAPGWSTRVKALRQAGPTRQSIGGTLALYIAVLLGRF